MSLVLFLFFKFQFGVQLGSRHPIPWTFLQGLVSESLPYVKGLRLLKDLLLPDFLSSVIVCVVFEMEIVGYAEICL